MRHIALLSALCISVSVSALSTASFAAPSESLKDRLAAARLEAQGNAPAALVVPPAPVANQAAASADKNSAPKTIGNNDAAKEVIQPPLMAIDAMPKPGATIPLASSPVMKAADDVAAAPVTPPQKTTQKIATPKAPAPAVKIAPPVTASAPVKIAQPVQIAPPVAKNADTIKNDIMTAKAVPLIQEKPVAKTAITWNEPQSVEPIKTVEPVQAAPVKTAAPVTAAKPVETVQAVPVMPAPAVPVQTAQNVTTQAVIPNEKLQPVVLPNAMIPLAPVAQKSQAKPVEAAPVVTETVVAETIVTETQKKAPAVAKTAQADIKTTAPAPEKMVTANAAPVAPVIQEEPKAAIKHAEKTAEKKENKQTAKAETKAAPKVETKPEFLPMPSSVAATQPKVVDATQKITVAARQAENVPAVPVIPVATKQTVAHVPAVSPLGAWTSRLVGSTVNPEAAFCLLENKFSNHTAVMIGQRPDGYSTIGINYGVDMLETGRQYSALVNVDDAFEESFNGYAESDRMLIVQLGKKPSFFAMLTNAQNLRVLLPGVASNFAVQGLGPLLEEFATCLSSIGGTLQKSAPEATLAQGQNMPAVAVGAIDSNDLTPPPIAAPEQMASNAATQNTVTPVPAASTAVNVKTGWSDYVHNVLGDAGIRPKNIQQNAGVTEWSDANGMHGQVWQVPGADLLEASMTQLDTAEQECGGEFTNQIGTPETVKGQTVQLMESKCSSATGVSVSTWLIQQNTNGAITAWEMRAPQAQNATSFDARQKILSAINTQPNS